MFCILCYQALRLIFSIKVFTKEVKVQFAMLPISFSTYPREGGSATCMPILNLAGYSTSTNFKLLTQPQGGTGVTDLIPYL